MNRETRRKLKLKSPILATNNEYIAADTSQAREYLKSIWIKVENGKDKPLFPMKMDDGRIINSKTATDEDILAILNAMSGEEKEKPKLIL